MAASVVKEVKSINGIPTLISRIHGPKFDITKCKNAVVIIPGNPGIIRFYDAYMASLFNKCDGKFPVFGIQHAGHGMLENVTLPKSAFNLDEQVKHKLSFLENCFPPMCKFILVGHSIGAYMVLKLFEYLGKDQTRIMKGILLFPTIERMATSPSGRVATPILNYFSLPLIAATWWLSQLPVIVKKWLIGIWFGQRKVHKDCKEAILELVNANSIRNLLFLAADEMKNVDQTPAQLISDHIDKLIFYYGATDAWTPRPYYDEMMRRFPQARIYLCVKNIRHAFVLESHEEMAELTSEWILK